jgi:predicted DNA-binding transcriptional regulator AlpA
MTMVYIENIIGFHEVAETLKVSKQRVYMLRQRSDFPKPITTLKATPLWDREAIVLYDSIRQHKPGSVKRSPLGSVLG